MWQHSEGGSLEGFPLLHIKPRSDAPDTSGWAEWLAAHPRGRTAPERGVNYALVRNALDGVRSDAGLLVCGLSCVLDALEAGSLRLPFPARESLTAPHPYRLHVRPGAGSRAQVVRFADWLAAEAARTKAAIEAMVGP